MFSSLADLVTLAIFLGVSPSVREALNAFLRGDHGRDIGAFKSYLKQVSMIQRDALWWLHDAVPKLYKTTNFHTLYPHCLRKVCSKHERFSLNTLTICQILRCCSW